MEVLMVGINKGGVGKSTSTSIIASELAYLGKKCLIIDFDQNTTMTNSILLNSVDIELEFDAGDYFYQKGGKFHINVGQVIVSVPDMPNIDLIPLYSNSVYFQKWLDDTFFKNSIENRIQILKSFLEEIKEYKKYDYVFFDIPQDKKVIKSIIPILNQFILVGGLNNTEKTKVSDFFEESEEDEENNIFEDLQKYNVKFDKYILNRVKKAERAFNNREIEITENYIKRINEKYRKNIKIYLAYEFKEVNNAQGREDRIVLRLYRDNIEILNNTEKREFEKFKDNLVGILDIVNRLVVEE